MHRHERVPSNNSVVLCEWAFLAHRAVNISHNLDMPVPVGVGGGAAGPSAIDKGKSNILKETTKQTTDLHLAKMGAMMGGSRCKPRVFK